jgi:hypothetical protein
METLLSAQCQPIVCQSFQKINQKIRKNKTFYEKIHRESWKAAFFVQIAPFWIPAPGYVQTIYK